MASWERLPRRHRAHERGGTAIQLPRDKLEAWPAARARANGDDAPMVEDGSGRSARRSGCVPLTPSPRTVFFPRNVDAELELGSAQMAGRARSRCDKRTGACAPRIAARTATTCACRARTLSGTYPIAGLGPHNARNGQRVAGDWPGQGALFAESRKVRRTLQWQVEFVSVAIAGRNSYDQGGGQE